MKGEDKMFEVKIENEDYEEFGFNCNSLHDLVLVNPKLDILEKVHYEE